MYMGIYLQQMLDEEPFGWNYKPAEKHCWLIFYERKMLFRLNKTDYKPDEQGTERPFLAYFQYDSFLF
jgi:hypothetical protein